MKYKLHYLLFFTHLISSGLMQAQMSAPMIRVKDAVRLDGVNNYTLIGYGLIVGLAGSGDSDEILTQRTISNVLENFNLIIKEDDLKAQNSAAIMVSATITNSAHKGDMIHATISSIGDATSLKGGELLLTALKGVDGETWAIAQGPVTTGGFSFGSGDSGGETISKGHPTVGMLTNGVKLLKDVGIKLPNSDLLTLFLKKSDYSSAVNLADAINNRFFGMAVAPNSSTVQVRIPKNYRIEGRISEFIRDVEQVQFQPDRKAKVVFNERSGTLVIGGNVKISSVAISHGSIHVNIKNTEGASQPSPFSQTGSTQQLNDQQTTVEEELVPVTLLPTISSVSDLVDALNALGVTPRDIMIIFHVLREAGALHASLEAI